MTQIAAGSSVVPAAGAAAAEAARAARLDQPVDLAFLFLSPEHLDDAADAAAAVRAELAPRRLLGCVAGGVVAGGRELEQGPAAAVWAASLPGASIETFHAVDEEPPELDAPAVVALLVEPFSFPAAPFLARLNEEHPSVPVVGGIAVGGRGAGAQALILDGELHDGGAVGVALSGIGVRTVVSQGCSPIGHDVVVTSAEGNVVYELAGEPALERLRRELSALPPERQTLAMRGLVAGLVIDENKPEYGRGDYLIRGVVGADEESGAIAIGETVRVGQTLRFHVRDADAADEDLRESLAGAVAPGEAAGALLFTCNGRGTNMFSTPDHDATAAVASVGDALAGFFCGGEIGPVGGRAFLHGFTATLAVFLR